MMKVEPEKQIRIDRVKFNNAVTQVVGYLVQKAAKEGRRQDQNHKTYIAGTAFWFEIKYDEKGNIVPNQEYILSFSVAPDLWDYKGIKDEIEEQERRWLIQSGVGITGLTPY